MTSDETIIPELPAESADDLVVAVEALPDVEAVAAVEALVRQPGAVTIAALHGLAASSRAAVSDAALSTLGRIGSPEAATALAALSEQMTSKDRRKAARRLLHRLGAAGVRPSALPAVEAPRPVPRRRSHQPLRGLVSSVDPEGNRLVHVALVEPAGGVVLLTALIGDERGVIQFTDRRMGRRRFEEEQRALLAEEWPIFVEAPAEYARFLVYEALAFGLSAGLRAPLEVLPWYDEIMAGQPAYGKALIYEHLDAADVRWNPTYLEESPALLELPEFAGWAIDPARVAPFDPESEAQQARIVLPDQTRRDQSAGAVQRAIAAVFDEFARACWRRRLEEMAYVLLRRGGERNARRALAAALALESPSGRQLLDVGPAVHPFLATLVDQAFERHREQRQAEHVRQGGLWVPRPGD